MMFPTVASNLDQEFEGEFVWHGQRHADAFLAVRKARLTIGYRDRPDTVLAEGDLRVAPRRAEPMIAAAEARAVVLLEPATTKDTGDAEHELTTSIEQLLAHLRAPSQETRQQETEAPWPSKS